MGADIIQLLTPAGWLSVAGALFVVVLFLVDTFAYLRGYRAATRLCTKKMGGLIGH